MRHPLLLLLAAALPAVSAAQRPASSDTLRLTIEDAVTRALRQGDEALLAAAQANVADAQVTTARAGGLPQLRFTGSFNEAIENARANSIGAIFDQRYTYNATLQLSWQIFQGGRVFAGSRAASRVRRAARLTAAEVRQQVAVDVQRAYLAVVVAERLATIQAQNLDLATARVAQLEQRQRAGQSARYDVLRARVERANLEPLAIDARNDLAVAELELKRLLDVPVEQPLRLMSTLDLGGMERVVAQVSSSPQPAASPRPRLLAAQLVRDARRDAIAVARADLLPTVNVFMNAGYLAFPTSGFPTGSGQVGNQFCAAGSAANRQCNNGGWFPDQSLGVQVSWPLFDGLRAKGNIDLAQANARAAQLQYELEQEAVTLEVARARAELERARAAFAAQRENAVQADEVFKLASLRADRGLGTQLEVSDAQLQLLTARTTEARAAFDLYLAVAELARTEGRPVPFPPTVAAPARISAADPAAPAPLSASPAASAASTAPSSNAAPSRAP